MGIQFSQPQTKTSGSHNNEHMQMREAGWFWPESKIWSFGWRAKFGADPSVPQLHVEIERFQAAWP